MKTKLFKKNLFLVLITLLCMFIIAGCNKEKNVENEELKIMIGDEEYTGSYTGILESGLASGSGTFTAKDDEWEYKGSFIESRASGNGTLTNKTIKLEFQDKSYEGLYSGETEEGIPNGTGSFSYEDGNDYLRYEGTLKDGMLAGQGSLETSFLIVEFKDVTRTGEFNGTTLDGIPNGFGTYSAVTDDNVGYTYNGNWENGIFNGQGQREYGDKGKDNGYCIEDGNWENGEYKPNFYEFLQTAGTYEDMPYTITEKSKTFMSEHDDLFPASKKSELKSYLNEKISYKKMDKNINKFGSEIAKLSNVEVLQVFERDTYFEYTVILVMDNDFKYSYIFYPGECDIYTGDKITVYGLPVSVSHFENVSGGNTNVVVFAGSFVEK